MSVSVKLPDLRSATDDFGWAYLLSSGDDRPHVVAVTPTWDGEELCFPVGRSSARNAVARPSVTLCYPPLDPGGYSLIVDGNAAVEGDDPASVRFTPTAAVLHRPAAPGSAVGTTGCASDCLPLDSRVSR
jgi:hypothetical protein